MTTKIEWADMTINPVVGCSKCSPGCDNCYAERQAARLVHMPQTAKKYAGVVDDSGKWTGVTNFDVACLTRLPKTPKRIFVGSMCDLFHDSVMDSHLEHIMGHIGLTKANSHHTFMLLTKRPERMRDFFTHWKPYRDMPNVWLGVTVCNQAEADAKIPVLLETPAAKRFVSVEPMLGPVDLHNIYSESSKRPSQTCGTPWGHKVSALNGQINHGTHVGGRAEFGKLDWVICGGETGPKARPMHPDWVRSLRDQCKVAGAPFFFKGWGEWQATTSIDIYNTPQPNGSLGREFPTSEGRAILADGRCCLIDLPEKPTKQFLQKRGYRLDAKPGHYISDQEAMNEAHEKGLHVMGYQWMYCTGKARTGRLLDGVEYNEFPT